MRTFFYRIKNAFFLFWWGLTNVDALRASNFKMLSDLLAMILIVGKEEKPRMTHIAYVHPVDKEEHKIVSIWAGAGVGADPYDRIAELHKENSRLQALLAKQEFSQ